MMMRKMREYEMKAGRPGWRVGRTLLWSVLLLSMAGCLPSSCRRVESQALLPADSLSRQRAEGVPADTMRLAWEATGPEAAPLVYPRTVRFSETPGGPVYVSDVERNSLLVFEGDGTFRREVTAPSFEVPYLAGVRGDTVLVFNPAALHVDFVADGVPVRQVTLAAARPPEQGLLYAAASEDAFFVKAVGEGQAGYLVQLDDRGAVTARYDLPAPYWRHAGLLRTWGDSLLSLSGFRPVVDVLAPGGPLDTLALRGFDSPMLARSRSFMLGDVQEAPLLSSSAAAAGDQLFVLNLRAGWLQVDVFDQEGMLQHRLVQADPAYNQQFFPQDLDVRRRPDGTYDLVVIGKEPVPRVQLYRWVPPPAGR